MIINTPGIPRTELEEDIIIDFDNAVHKMSYNLYQRTKTWHQFEDFLKGEDGNVLEGVSVGELQLRHKMMIQGEEGEVETIAAIIYSKRFGSEMCYTAQIFPLGMRCNAFLSMDDAGNWCDNYIMYLMKEYKKDKEDRKGDEITRRIIL